MIRAALKRVARADVVDRYDVMFALGGLAFGYGTWYLYPPATVIAGGALLMAAGVAGARRRKTGRRY